MKSLKRVQKIAKLLCLFDHIAFWFALVGTVLCAASGLILLLFPSLLKAYEAFVLSFHDFKDFEHLGILLIADSVFMLGETVTASFACKYFENELVDGTPFTHRGAKELLRLGIITLIVPIIAVSLSYGITYLSEVENTLSNEIEAVTGIWMIIFSVIFHYGADLEKEREEKGIIDN